MSEVNGLNYGVTFGGKHSIKDWGLYLKEWPEISPPEPKTNFVDIPGADGSIDLTEALTGRPTYKDREISFTFSVVDGRKQWPYIYSEIMAYLHGQKLQVTLDVDPYYYYEGRFQVDKWTSDKCLAQIVIKGTVSPYKLENGSSTGDWEWDPFSFETGYAREYSDIEISGTKTMTLANAIKPVSPTFTVTLSSGDSMEMVVNGETYTLEEGENHIAGLWFTSDTKVTFNGYGTITIDYQGGRF